MNTLHITDIDYRNILINHYKELKLTENELIVLLMIDSTNKLEQSLITGEQLAFKMNLSAKEIDEIIVSLMNKKFLNYKQSGDILITSNENTYNIIVEFLKKRIVNDEISEIQKEQDQEASKVLKTLEAEMKRSLTSLEMEKVINWFKEGVNINVINNSINECIMKRGKITINQVDKLIVKNLTHVDRVQEGVSTVSERTKIDIKKAMEIASYDWVNNDD